MDKLASYWNKFLSEKNMPESTPYAGECCFGTDELSSCTMLALVLSGQKTATFSALEAFTLDNEQLPHRDFYYIVVDWLDEPKAIIKTTNVSIMAYKDITWELAQKEGESESMEEWIQTHNDFFSEDSDIVGYKFHPESAIVCEQFEVVYK